MEIHKLSDLKSTLQKVTKDKTKNKDIDEMMNMMADIISKAFFAITFDGYFFPSLFS